MKEVLFCVVIKNQYNDSNFALDTDYSGGQKRSFLKMLELFDFVKVEDQDAFLKQFIENAPADVPLSDADIVAEVMAGRYG